MRRQALCWFAVVGHTEISESLQTDNKLDSLSYGNSDFEKFQIVEPILTFQNFELLSKTIWIWIGNP